MQEFTSKDNQFEQKISLNLAMKSCTTLTRSCKNENKLSKVSFGLKMQVIEAYAYEACTRQW